MFELSDNSLDVWNRNKSSLDLFVTDQMTDDDGSTDSVEHCMLKQTLLLVSSVNVILNLKCHCLRHIAHPLYSSPVQYNNYAKAASFI